MRITMHKIKIQMSILWGLLTEILYVVGLVVIGYLICLFFSK